MGLRVCVRLGLWDRVGPWLGLVLPVELRLWVCVTLGLRVPLCVRLGLSDWVLEGVTERVPERVALGLVD